MKKIVGKITEFSLGLWQNRKVRDRVLSALVILVVLQIYFVRELLAAELLFGLLFAALLLLGGICYAVGALGEYGLDWAEVGVRVLAKYARRGYTGLEEISKKSFRHPRSESAR
jgi:predicted membrane channel-forming protein YqfA (hemolysin III family)